MQEYLIDSKKKIKDCLFKLEKNIQNDKKTNELFQSLKEVNAKLWVIEDDKRTCEKNADFGEKFIKLSNWGCLVIWAVLACFGTI